MPLVIYGPQHIASGVVSEVLVDASDIFPTLLEWAGVPVPSGLEIDGRSIVAQVDQREERPAGRDWVFSQYADVRVVRNERFKLFSTGRLYDLKSDPGEQHDLAMKPSTEAAVAQKSLQAVLDRLPPNVDLPFEPRSSSAFKLREQRAKASPK